MDEQKILEEWMNGTNKQTTNERTTYKVPLSIKGLLVYLLLFRLAFFAAAFRSLDFLLNVFSARTRTWKVNIRQSMTWCKLWSVSTFPLPWPTGWILGISPNIDSPRLECHGTPVPLLLNSSQHFYLVWEEILRFSSFSLQFICIICNRELSTACVVGFSCRPLYTIPVQTLAL